MNHHVLENGLFDLSSCLNEFNDILKNTSLVDEIKISISNYNIEKKEFIKSVPDSIIKLATLYFNKSVYLAFIKFTSDPIAVKLQTSKKQFIEHFSDISDHPIMNDFYLSFQERMLEITESTKQKLEPNPIDQATKKIAGVQYCQTLVRNNTDEKLLPLLRYFFTNERNELILDSQLDWEDCLFLIEAISGIFMTDFEKNIQFEKQKLLVIPGKETFSFRIRKIDEQIKKIIQLAPEYSISFDQQTEEKEQQ